MKFYICTKCGKIVEMIKGSPCPTMCCGQPMEELTPNTTDGAHEKHVPVVEIDGNKVTVCVGSAAHPMLEAHYIQWIVLETSCGQQKKVLAPGAEPKAEFLLAEGETAVAAYEYCNLHGLWKKDC